MTFLLDTHTLLWFVGASKRLSVNARKLIENPDNRVIVSSISLFEISIKLKICKLALDKPLDEIYRDVQDSLVDIMPISNPHLLSYQDIPLYTDHRDPFDRLILAAAVVEKADIITLDPKFQYYTDLVKIVW